MYCDDDHLDRLPFPAQPEPSALWMSTGYRVALERIFQGLQTGQEMVALLGASGLGKTTLLRACLTHQERPYRIIAVRADNITFAELLQQIEQALGIADETKPFTEPLDKIRGRLLQEAVQSRPVVLIIDNAHDLSMEALKHLPRLTERQTSPTAPLQMVLVGQPVLGHKLAASSLKQIKNTIATWAMFHPLDRQESIDYIQHYLSRTARFEPTVFSAGAMKQVSAFANGIPALLNMICTDMLHEGYRHRKRRLRTTSARRVIAEYTSEIAGKRRVLWWQWGVMCTTGLLLVVCVIGRSPSARLPSPATGYQRLAHIFPFLPDRSRPSTVAPSGRVHSRMARPQPEIIPASPSAVVPANTLATLPEMPPSVSSERRQALPARPTPVEQHEHSDVGRHAAIVTNPAKPAPPAGSEPLPTRHVVSRHATAPDVSNIYLVATSEGRRTLSMPMPPHPPAHSSKMPEREVRKDLRPPTATGPVHSDSLDQFSPVMPVPQAMPPREAERPSPPLQRVSRTEPTGSPLAPQQPLQHTLHIRTDPDGAVVSINGRYAGATPVTLHLEPDAYRVTIEKDGYLRVTDHLTLDPHRTSDVDHILIEEGND